MFNGQPPNVYMPGRGTGNTNAAATSTSTVAVMAGTDIEGTADHLREVQETESNTVKCVPNYRNRLKHLIKFWKDHYPEYYDEVVFDLTQAQKCDTRRYHTATQDLRFELLNPLMMKLFLSGHAKTMEGGRHYSFVHARKYHDSVLYCAKLAGKNLTQQYVNDMKAFIKTFKKEKANAKSEGKCDENDADEIPFTLFEAICRWAIQSGSLMLWAFTVVQWNIMGRSVNVDPLGFHNFSRDGGSDCICITLDKNKTDQAGENVSPKTCYANPGNPTVCINLALACYLCVNRDIFNHKSDKVFRKKGKDRSASATYCIGLKKLVSSCAEYAAYVLQYCRLGHFHPHGTRKGAATFVTTNTMDPPPIPSILRRGEWFMGKVLEVYWKWSKIGDTYLGRCIAGLDPDSDNFDVLPPHFILGYEHALKDESIKEAMEICFGPILKAWGDKCGLAGIFLLLLASIVYHSEFLLQHTAEKSAHPFLDIPILQRTELLEKLRSLVTLDPRGDIVWATGVPRHSKMMKKIVATLDVVKACMEKMDTVNDTLPSRIKDAIDDKAAESGQVTAHFVIEKLEEHSKAVSTVLGDQIKRSVADVLRDLNIPQPLTTAGDGDGDAQTNEVETTGVRYGRFREFCYRESVTNGRLFPWAVPEDFDWPAAKLQSAWFAYLIGYPNNRSLARDDDTGELLTDVRGEHVMVRTPIRPLRHLTDDLLPRGNLKSKRLKKRFRDDWRPVLKVIHEVNRAAIANTHEALMDNSFLQETFYLGIAHLKSKYPHLFDGTGAARCHI